MSIWRWAQHFSDTPEPFRISLGEGETPLLRSRRIGPASHLKNLYFKLENANPSGSYKDRFAAAAISDMLARGKTRCLATSSGNTGAALAAYCAAVDLACEIAIVETAPLEKLKQMMAYGANIYKVKGFGINSEITARVFEGLKERARGPDAALQISAFHYSPVGMAGVQTIAYELLEQLENRIDRVFIPAGGGGLALAVARGFARGGSIRPRIECVQPKGNDTISTPLREGSRQAREVACQTAIGGLQVPTVIDGHDLIPACRDSGGTGHVVSDEEAWEMQKRLAQEEGIFCEPAGAVSVAGALAARERGEVEEDEHVVCLITGSGFKDSPSIDRMLGDSVCPILAEKETAALR